MNVPSFCCFRRARKIYLPPLAGLQKKGFRNGAAYRPCSEIPEKLRARLLLDIPYEISKGVKRMDENRTEKNFDRLTKRREHLVMTLRHLDRESEQVEQNTDWLDQAAYENRTALLDRLNDWYLAEVKQIDRALERIKTQKYGICLACHHSIDPKRLEIVPETEYCGACEMFREGVVQSRA